MRKVSLFIGENEFVKSHKNVNFAKIQKFCLKFMRKVLRNET
jgi:hypothetical protein